MRRHLTIGLSAALLAAPVALFAAQPAPDGPELRVNDFTAGDQVYPSIAIDGVGNFVVAWTDSSGIYVNGDDVWAQSFDAAGGPLRAQFVVNSYTEFEQRNPSVSVNGTGAFVIVWESDLQDGSGFGIFAQRYDSAGGAAGGEFMVNSHTTGSQRYPAGAIDGAGEVIVVWEGAGTGDPDGIFARRYDSTGAALGGQFLVNTHTTDAQRLPAIGTSPSGGFIIAWQSDLQDGSGRGVYAQRYDSSGTAQGGEIPVNTVTAGDQDRPSIAVDGGGGFVVAWESDAQDGSGEGIFARRFDSTGAAMGSEIAVNSFTTGSQSYPSVTRESAGAFVVVWQSYGQDGSYEGIFGQRYDETGAPDGGEFAVNGVTASIQRAPAAAMDGAGQLVVAWQSYGQDDGFSFAIDAQRFDPTGAPPAETEIQANDVTASFQRLPAAAATDAGALDGPGRSVIVWQSAGEDGSGSGVFARRIGPDGAPAGAAFQVNTTTADDQGDPSVASDPAGDFVVAWVSTGQDAPGTGGVFARRFDSAGSPQGGEFAVNSHTTDTQSDPAVSRNAAGFVVVWQSYGQDGSYYGIFGQRFNSAGTALGPEFQVNSTALYSQINPSVALAGGGGFVVVWQSYGQDGSGYGIFGQRFSASGTPTGGEFQVNSHGTDFQTYPKVAAEDSGDFVVVWQSYGQDGSGYGVHAQRFTSAGATVGGEFRVNTHTTGYQWYPSVGSDGTGGFTVVWESFGQEAAGDSRTFGVTGQRYDSLGAALGGEFQVNSYTSGDQRAPAVSVASAGGFLVTWDSAQDGSETGIFAQRFNEDGCPSPAVSDPGDQTVCEGDVATFSVTAFGTGPFTYQWRRDGLDLSDGGNVSGATTDTLTINPAGPADGASYDCVVTDGCATAQSVTSAAAVLTVLPLPDNVGESLRAVTDGIDITFTWTDVADSDDYVVREDTDPAGTFPTVTGSAVSGNPGLTVSLPAGNRFYLVAGRNGDCGEGPLK